MAFEDHIKEIRNYFPANTEHGIYQAELAKVDVVEIKNCLQKLIKNAEDSDSKKEILNCINSGIQSADELSDELSKISQSKDKISFILDVIEQDYREAKRLIAYRE